VSDKLKWGHVNVTNKKVLQIKVFGINLLRALRIIPNVWYASEFLLAGIKAQELEEFFSGGLPVVKAKFNPSQGPPPFELPLSEQSISAVKKNCYENIKTTPMGGILIDDSEVDHEKLRFDR